MKRIVYLIVTVLLLSCSADHETQRILSRAGELIEKGQPDSALAFLQGYEREKADWSKKDRMHYELIKLKAENKADVVFSSDSVITQVVDYYKSHGTANEQMLAYYLLGRVYSDMGEAPMALQAYYDAIEKADTANKDCDYAQLSRVYAQMGTLFYAQSLYQEHLNHYQQAQRYAWMARDTLAALACYVQEAVAYKRLHKNDSALYIYEDVANYYSRINLPSEAAIALGGTLKILIESGLYGQARKHMLTYESSSGLFDQYGNIQKGKEIFYYLKGLLYLEEHRLDSAEYWFRKELSEGKGNVITVNEKTNIADDDVVSTCVCPVDFEIVVGPLKEGAYTLVYFRDEEEFARFDITYDSKLKGTYIVPWKEPVYKPDMVVDGICYSFYSKKDQTVWVAAVPLGMENYKGDIVIPEQVKYEGKTYSVIAVGLLAFEGCSDLISATLPESITFISISAFSGCTKLKSFNLPKRVESIGGFAFEGCKQIKEIYSYNPKVPFIDYGNPFDESVEQNATLYVPQGSKEVYSTDVFWKNFKNIEEMP